MRTFWIAGLLLCLMLSTGHDSGVPVYAQDDAPKSKATDRRPINDQMTDAEARAAIDAAADGDKEALQKLKDGRLAYVPVLLKDDRAFNLAYSLLRAEIGWVRDMQRWEIVLLGYDTRQMEATFKELKDRFVDADSQLARAIIKADTLGERDAALRLVALSPEAPCVLAALAWIGEVSDPVRRVNLLIDSLDPKYDVSNWNLVLQAGMLDEDTSEEEHASTEYIEQEVELFMKPEGVDELFAAPHEWAYGQFYEKLGILVHDLSPEERDAAITRIDKQAPEGSRRSVRYLSFIYGAKYGEPGSEFKCSYAWLKTSYSTVGMCYAKTVAEEDSLTRRVGAISTFWGAPDWAPAQQFLLQQAFAAHDARFAQLAIRAVLAVNDDRLRAVNSVARALRELPGFETERKAFGAALKESKNAVLQKVALAMEGGEFPAEYGNPVLGLSQAQKAALTRVFMHEDELKAYGGAEAAYLMNLSQYRFARHSVTAAMHAAAQSIELAAAGSKRRLGQTNAYLTYRMLRNMIGRTNVAAWLEQWAEQYPLAVQILRNNVKAWDKPTAELESAVYAVEREVSGGEAATAEQRALLAEDYSVAGGYGLHLVGRLEGRESLQKRNEYYVLAEQVTPSDFHVYQQRLPFGDWYGRYWYRDWALAEHLIMCKAMLQPYNWTTFQRLGALLAKAGSDPHTMAPLLMQATCRIIQPFQGGNTTIGLERLLFDRFGAARLLRKNGAVNGALIPGATRNTYVSSLKRTCWGMEWQAGICWGPLLSNRSAFTVACANCEYDNRDQEDVNFLLNLALELKGNSPAEALKLVSDADRIGVSRYGRFVGSQSYVHAKARLGEFDAAFKRWEEFRDGTVGYPPYLDKMLLHGMAQANDYANLAKALKEIDAREDAADGAAHYYGLRRALMAAGEHARIAKVPVPQPALNSRDTFNFGNYTEAFFEARQLLQSGEVVELHQRAVNVWRADCELEIGVIVDSFILRALTGFLLPEFSAQFVPDDKGLLHIMSARDFHWFHPSETLDYEVLEVLFGTRKPADLPPVGNGLTWHGMRFSERPIGYEGSGFLTEGEALARDHFIRGVLAFLCSDNASARNELQACVKADQRFSHEYHVAEWLLEKQIPKK